MEKNKKLDRELLQDRVEKIITWIKNSVKKAGRKGVIFGLSGGLDSAVLAVLCQRAFSGNAMALILPCESIENDTIDAMKIVNKFNVNYKNIDLTPIYREVLSITKIDHNDRMAKANIKPRLRMIMLYYFASILGYLVVGASNKSEISIGYFTKYGDGGVDILPLGNILKTEIFEIARFLEIPENIISKPPSAGLWENQTDEQEMGFNYEQLDSFLRQGTLKNKEIEKTILAMNRSSAHKRKRPPIPNI